MNQKRWCWIALRFKSAVWPIPSLYIERDSNRLWSFGIKWLVFELGVYQESIPYANFAKDFCGLQQMNSSMHEDRWMENVISG